MLSSDRPGLSASLPVISAEGEGVRDVDGVRWRWLNEKVCMISFLQMCCFVMVRIQFCLHSFLSLFTFSFLEMTFATLRRPLYRQAYSAGQSPQDGTQKHLDFMKLCSAHFLGFFFNSPVCHGQCSGRSRRWNENCEVLLLLR